MQLIGVNFDDDQNGFEGVISYCSITTASVDCFFPPFGVSRGYQVYRRINLIISAWITST